MWGRDEDDEGMMKADMVAERRRFAAAYLRCFDAEQAAQEVGREDGLRMLSSPAVQREVEFQRGQCDICRRDVLRWLAQLAFGRANDCVRLVLEERPEVEKLDLRLLSEVKRSEKGTVEVKLVDRVRALERLLEAVSAEDGSAAAEAFFAAAEDVDTD